VHRLQGLPGRRSEWNELRDEVGHNHGTYDNPQDLSAETWTLMRFTEHETDAGNLEWLIRKDGCMHCAEPVAWRPAPAPGAIIKHANGIVDFNQDHCIGCGYCITGCPFNIPRISQKDHKAYKCTLCSDRVAVGLEPACVKTCPTGAIVFGTKEDMKEHAAERIVDLKSAALTTPVCTTPQASAAHVMYVLHHADTPKYAGLPADPAISPLVGLWKGVSKPLALLAMGAAVLAGFFHYARRSADRGRR
jgi:formate dehydrogenase iron-sulfur subunit